MQNLLLYLFCALCALLFTSAATHLILKFAGQKLLDVPSGLKNHSAPTPLAGGPAMAAGIFISLAIVRFTLDFPSGTLRSLRGILAGALIIFVCGFIDDIKKPAGISPLLKLAAQLAAAAALIFYGVKINFTGYFWADAALTALWVTGLTNAFNLLDIADSLAVSQAVSAALFFIITTLPSEHIYVNFAAAAMLGAALGFWPYNISKTRKSFMGDSGSMLLGFILAAVSMGAEYSFKNPAAVLAPLLILAVPLWDTAFVFTARILQGKNPLKGSPDHAVIRLKNYGFAPNTIVLTLLAASIIYGALALWVINMSPFWTYVITAFAAADAVGCGIILYRLKK